MAVQSDDNINLETLPASELKRKHWKYVGYRGFCEFVTSDDDFFILRRFSQLTARVLLALQDELTELESQLSILETQLSSRSAPDMHNGSFREETSQTRLDIIQEIDKKLRAYSQPFSTKGLLKSLTHAKMNSSFSIQSFVLALAFLGRTLPASRTGFTTIPTPFTPRRRSTSTTLEICSPWFRNSRHRSVSS